MHARAQAAVPARGVEPESEARARARVEPEREVKRPAVDAKPDPVVAGVAGTPAARGSRNEPLARPAPSEAALRSTQRIDARFAWPIGGTAAVAAATALIWSGLSAGGHGAVGSGVAIDPNTNQRGASDRVLELPIVLREKHATTGRAPAAIAVGRPAAASRGRPAVAADPATVLTRADGSAVAVAGGRRGIGLAVSSHARPGAEP